MAKQIKVVIGANFGDEGKGLMTDYFCKRLSENGSVLNIRFNGGAQAGHMGTKTCPHCGKPIADTYARVVGFYTPVSSYQNIRKQEFNKRKWYDVLTKSEVM